MKSIILFILFINHYTLTALDEKLPDSLLREVTELGGEFNLDGHTLGMEKIANLYCAMPLRFFPIIDEGNGDCYGLYYPRGQQKAWVVHFGIEESSVSVLTTNVDNFKKNKALHFDARCKWPKDERFPYEITIERTKNEQALAAELGSIPLHFLVATFDWGLRDKIDGPPVKSGEEVRSWFLASNKLNALFSTYFKNEAQLMQWRPWFSLGQEYEKHGDINSAMNCFDMAIRMTSRFPNYGEAEKSGPKWSALRDILALMKPTVDKSDSIDKCTFSIIHQSAIRFSKE